MADMGEFQQEMKMDTRTKRMMEGAQHYAAADKSDPFAYARALTHLRTGIASIRHDGEDAFYKAEPAQEMRMLPDGTGYSVAVYRNIQRP